ncbi:MAG: Ig-like domain-containing protein [Flavobacteriales bacterium]
MTRNSWAALALLLLAACAQVKEPTGGPKDTRPPELLSAEPADGSTNFTGGRIVLHFDERVKLDRVRERLLISPPLVKAPDVSVSGGTDVVITLNAPLAANTTYTFNIGEAVKDLSEGNAAAGLSFVVSTGGHVDSLSITGQVLDAFSGLPASDVLVLLHEANDTGTVRTSPPAYFTRTATDGRFTLAHLRDGPKRLTALRDRNANYRFDLPNEEIAFLDCVINPRDTTVQVLYMFQPASAKQFISAATVLVDRGWQMVLARRAGELSLSSLDREGGHLVWWPEWSSGRDTVVFWPSDTTLLNGQRFIVSEDSVELDTLTYRALGAMPFNLVVTPARDAITGRWILRSTRPVAEVDTAHAQLRVDTIPTPFLPFVDSTLQRTVGIDLQIPPGKSASLTLYPKAIRGVMGGTNDTTRLTLGARDPRSLGKLKVELVVDSGMLVQGPLLLQLLTGQGKAVREVVLNSLPGETQWTDLAPGSYGLKLIQDRNNDGRWTTGSFLNDQQPERVFLDLEPVLIRAGWAVERTWGLKNHP